MTTLEQQNVQMQNALLEIITLHSKSWFNEENPHIKPWTCEECNRADHEGLHPTEYPCPTRAIAENGLAKLQAR